MTRLRRTLTSVRIKVSDAEMAAINIERDGFHGEWNYTISPVTAKSAAT